MIVVDASLATKWITEEPDSRQALRFLTRFSGQLCGPDLLYNEVAGAVVRRANTGVDPRPKALVRLRLWAEAWEEQTVISYRLTAHLLSQAGQLAMSVGHPLSDCIYLALAIELECDLATCDDKFRAKAGRLYPGVKALADYHLGDPPPPTRH